jgi:uncharacterized membrane protein YeiH
MIGDIYAYISFMRLIDFIEILGTSAFALSGAFSAMRKKLDVFGVLIITFITAIGGGTIRDLLIGSTPVAWLLDIQIVLSILFTYLLALFFLKYLLRFQRTIFWFDTIGLAVFCVVAIDKALSFDLHPIICIALGTVTGCFGGILRDVILNEIPYVFRKDIYASACIAGGIVYFVTLFSGIAPDLKGWFAGTTIILIRILATYFEWRLPLIYVKDKR